jgi:hypothetical protein
MKTTELLEKKRNNHSQNRYISKWRQNKEIAAIATFTVTKGS